MRRQKFSPYRAKVTLYATGSVIALLTSVVAFLILYLAGAGTTGSTIGAFVIGAIPNWVLNRRWAWKVKGQVHFLRAILVYVTVSVVVVALASVSTGWADAQLRSIPGHGTRAALVTAVYVAIQFAVFVAKFVVYEHWVFSGASRLRAAAATRRALRLHRRHT